MASVSKKIRLDPATLTYRHDELVPNDKLPYREVKGSAMEMASNSITSSTTTHHQQAMIINDLLNRLKLACQERDEARYLLQQFMIKHNYNLLIPTISPSSNYFSSSSSSEDFRNMNMVDSMPISSTNYPTDHQYYNNADLVIEKLIEGKRLPEKGKFLQAVIDAGLMLDRTLMRMNFTTTTTFTCPPELPKWRNPPPIEKYQKSLNYDLNHQLINFSAVGPNIAPMPPLKSLGSCSRK